MAKAGLAYQPGLDARSELSRNRQRFLLRAGGRPCNCRSQGMSL